MGGFISGLGSGASDKDSAPQKIADAIKKKHRKSAVSDSSSSGGDTYNPDSVAAGVPSYKKGGKVRKTGLALLHKGERVLTKAQNRKRMKGK
jgi:hypothetical protein